MLEIIGVCKSYGKKTALNDIHIKMEPGVYGLLGPNGAGKSTLMKIITDNLIPDKGEVLWNGKSIFKKNQAYRMILGYAPQQQGLYDNFTGRKFLGYMAALKDISKNKIVEEIEMSAGRVNLTERLDDKIKNYSGGMKQRLLVAQALMGQPQLLVLDEPTAGLDPKERVRVRETLEDIAGDKIILVATHVVSDIESIAKEIIILKEGNLVAMDSTVNLIEKFAKDEDLELVYMNIFGENGEEAVYD